MTLATDGPEWLRNRAALTPGRFAIECGPTHWTFAELDRRADAVAGALAREGVRQSDLVAVLGWNSAAYAALVWGLIRLGAVTVPLNARLTPGEIAWQLADCGARFLITDEACRPDAEAAIVGHSVRLFDLETLASSSPGEGVSAEWDLENLHSVIYTSGTTGKPKGAMLSYANHFFSAIGSALKLGLDEHDRWLVCLPLFHIGGLSILFKSVIYGVPAVIHENFDPEAVNAAIDNGGITRLSVVSTMLQRMLVARGDRPYPPSLRTVLLGGGPIPPDLVQRSLALALPVAPTYGLTEACSQVATLAPSEVAASPDSVGTPLFMTEVQVVAEDSALCGPGEVGEIIVRGPTVTAGYFGRPEETKKLLAAGWLHTGDWGHFDSEGNLHILDRRDDIILSGGENVYPAEVEAVLATHPAIAEAAVFGLPDAEWGQIVTAAVCLTPGADTSEDDLREFCRTRMATYKAPRAIFFVNELPRTATGKIRRRELRESLSG